MKSSRLGLKIFVSFFLAAAWPGRADTPALPQNMAAMGDSITAGVFANFKRTDAHNPLALPKFLYYLGELGLQKTLSVFTYPANSWATGMDEQVRSQATRFLQLADNEGASFDSLNAAVSGATSLDLASQLQNILNWSQSKHGQSAPDYVVIEMGANDACQGTAAQMTSLSDYYNNVHNAAEAILKNNPSSHVLLGGLPNVTHLREVAENAWLGFPPLLYCHDSWNLTGECSDMLKESDPAQRQLVTDREQGYMNELVNVAQDLNNTYGADRVRLADSIYAYNFTADEISIDCFHPDPQGQQALSDMTWQQSWWSDLDQ